MQQTPTNPLKKKRHYIVELEKALDRKIKELTQKERKLDEQLQSVSQTEIELDKIDNELKKMATAQAAQLQELEKQEIAIKQLTEHFWRKLMELEDIEKNLGPLLLLLAEKAKQLEQQLPESIKSILPSSP